MKVEQQTDGTFLASMVINGRLTLVEDTTQDGAWYGMIDVVDQVMQEQFERQREAS